MNIHHKIRFYALLLVLVSVAACEDTTQPTTVPTLPTTNMQIGSKTFTLEIAKTEHDREHGLMQRDSMAQDHGMIFVFQKASIGPFWMKNTRIPLDIIYIDSDAKVVAIKQMKPYDLTPVPSPRPYKWAIELNKDATRETGLKEGDTLTIPQDAQTASEYLTRTLPRRRPSSPRIPGSAQDFREGHTRKPRTAPGASFAADATC